MNLFAAYAIIGACVAVVGCGLFMALCAALVRIRNKRVKQGQMPSGIAGSP